MCVVSGCPWVQAEPIRVPVTSMPVLRTRSELAAGGAGILIIIVYV